MANKETMAHLNNLMSRLSVGDYLIPVQDAKTIDFSDPNKVTVETFDGFVAEETDAWQIASLKETLGWK